MGESGPTKQRLCEQVARDGDKIAHLERERDQHRGIAQAQERLTLAAEKEVERLRDVLQGIVDDYGRAATYAAAALVDRASAPRSGDR